MIKTILIISLCLLGLLALFVLVAVYALKMLIEGSEDRAAELEIYTSDGRLRDEAFPPK